VSQFLAKENFEFVLAIGDDATDEEMFNVLKGENQYTIKVGLGNTGAKYNIVGLNNVLAFLNHLGNCLEQGSQLPVESDSFNENQVV
jgi:trehalose 6-phosphate synthase/phosphatase